MTSPNINTGIAKPSFAKVAAMAPPTKPVKKANLPTNARDTQMASALRTPKSSLLPQERARAEVVENGSDAQQGVLAISKEMDRLTVIDEGSDQPFRAGSMVQQGPLAIGRVDDERSQLSNSSTKPPSFDSKSMASENTFAMEEKESLRPDDSASVQATDEDESVFLPPESTKLEHQLSLDAGSSSSRRVHQGMSVAVRPSNPSFPVTTMLNPPKFGEMVPTVVPVFPQLPISSLEPAVKHDPEPVTQDPPIHVPPDDKLVEAMGTPKDRLLLLQLEEKFVAFIAQSGQPTLDLPPQNAYERLLAHKLADYYNLDRINSTDPNCLRLYKAPCLQPPVSLREVCNALEGKNTGSTAPVAVKIMRRTTLPSNKALNESNTAASSTTPSKPTSETGADNGSDQGIPSPPEATPSRDRSQWTREEREAHYKAARERIFRDFQEPPSSENSTGDTSANMSRSSSVNGRKRTHKQRIPKDDSFEARSSYVPGYRGMTYAPQAPPAGGQTGPIFQSPHGGRPAFRWGPNLNASDTAAALHSQYDPGAMGMSTGSYAHPFGQQYGACEAWAQGPPPPPPGSYYGYGAHVAAGYGGYGPMMSSSTYPVPSPNPQWSGTPYSQPSQPPSMGPGSMAPNGSQMPWVSHPSHQAHTGRQDGNFSFGTPLYPPFSTSPSATPGAFPPSQRASTEPYHQRPSFNPQIRSFVPNMSAVRYGGGNQVPSGYFQPGNSSSAAALSTGPPPGPGPEGGGAIGALESHGQVPDGPDAPGPPTPASRNRESLRKKWGTPSHLPKKPPPSQMSPNFDLENMPPLPSRQAFSQTCV